MCKFDLYVCGFDLFCTVGLIFVEVRFICMRFDLFLYGSIYFLLFCYEMNEFRFICACLILNERVLRQLFAKTF